MDSRFVDLDLLLTRVREPRSKVHIEEAVRASKRVPSGRRCRQCGSRSSMILSRNTVS
jgi:hypothetical protein